MSPSSLPTSVSLQPIIQRWERLGAELGTDLYVVRDDLLPFPLAGNKVRKLSAEFAAMDPRVGIVLSNGDTNSNHCRTLAWMASLTGRRAHCVLHATSDSDPLGLDFLAALGATYEVVEPPLIGETLDRRRGEHEASGHPAIVLAGGGHSTLGAVAYRDAGTQVFEQLGSARVYVASGTGATQGGLVAAASVTGNNADVVGVSVARRKSRGKGPVAEAACWAGAVSPIVDFRDDFVAGGYGKWDERITEAVRRGWAFGLPLDPTYTGKAFAALLSDAQKGEMTEKTVFWHTGGLANWVAGAAGGGLSEQKQVWSRAR